MKYRYNKYIARLFMLSYLYLCYTKWNQSMAKYIFRGNIYFTWYYDRGYEVQHIINNCNKHVYNYTQKGTATEKIE